MKLFWVLTGKWNPALFSRLANTVEIGNCMSKHIKTQIHKADAEWPKKCIKAVISPAEELRQLHLKGVCWGETVGTHCYTAQLTLEEAPLVIKMYSWTSLNNESYFHKAASAILKLPTFIFIFDISFSFHSVITLLKEQNWETKLRVSLKSQILFSTEYCSCIT